MLFTDKTVMITGANGGIGRALIENFAEQGANIVAQLRKQNIEFDQFADRITNKYGVNIEQIYFDLENESEIKDSLSSLLKSKKDIDVLINNAGIAHGGLLQMTSIIEIKRVFQINYFATVQISQTVSRLMMRKKSGTIINIASVAGIDAEAGNSAYGASKAAVIAFTKSLAKEMAAYNIRVNAIAPGLTATRMADQMEDKAAVEMVGKSAFNRLGKVEEIADAVLYIASEKASFITGQVLRVDGGM